MAIGPCAHAHHRVLKRCVKLRDGFILWNKNTVATSTRQQAYIYSVRIFFINIRFFLFKPAYQLN